MKINNRKCDICGAMLFNDRGYRNQVHMYNFKRIDRCFLSDKKDAITKIDICDKCLFDFTLFCEDRENTRLVRISADCGASWTEQFLTEREIAEHISDGYLVVRSGWESVETEVKGE